MRMMQRRCRGDAEERRRRSMCVTGRGRGDERRDEELSQLRQLRRGARDAGRGGVQCKAKWGGEPGGGRVLLPWYHRLTSSNVDFQNSSSFSVYRSRSAPT